MDLACDFSRLDAETPAIYWSQWWLFWGSLNKFRWLNQFYAADIPMLMVRWETWCIVDGAPHTLGGACGWRAQWNLGAAIVEILPFAAATCGAVCRVLVQVWLSVRVCIEGKLLWWHEIMKKLTARSNWTSSVWQNKFSTSSQEDNPLTSIWQKAISTDNDARRTIAANTR
jgi:hypothetical protein